MKKIQRAGDYSIFRKRSGRHAVQDKNKNWVNAEEKAKIDEVLPQLRIAPTSGHSALSAPPGSGKTTRVTLSATPLEVEKTSKLCKLF